MPVSDSLHAHCPICGNQDLKRISPEYVNSPLGFVWRTLRVPAYRCEPCRHKYFTILPRHNAESAAEELSSAD
jgi:transposase-like protein